MRDKDYLGENVIRPDYIESKNGFETPHPYFVDVICSQFERRDTLQIPVDCTLETDMYLTDSSTEQIETQFWIYFLSERLLLLNHHYEFFLNKGGQMLDFMEWLERTFLVFKKNRKLWEEYTDLDSFI